MEKDYVIFSPKHTNGIACWWAPDSAGYTDCIDRAGRYAQTEAESIQRSTHGDAVAIHVSELELLKPKRIVDCGWMINGQVLDAWKKRAKEESQPA